MLKLDATESVALVHGLHNAPLIFAALWSLLIFSLFWLIDRSAIVHSTLIAALTFGLFALERSTFIIAKTDRRICFKQRAIRKHSTSFIPFDDVRGLIRQPVLLGAGLDITLITHNDDVIPVGMTLRRGKDAEKIATRLAELIGCPLVDRYRDLPPANGESSKDA